MKFHKQLNKHEPPESWGDCMRTCIACMLDKHPREVPNFFENAEDEEGQERAWRHLDAWLLSQGYRTALFIFRDNPLKNMLNSASNCYYILTGSSMNGGGHAVIAKDDKIVFDPSWTDIGIHGPAEGGYYTVMLLIDNKFADCPSVKE